MKKAAVKVKKVIGHKLAPKLPEGTAIGDAKSKWKIGAPIGCGGFGTIYLTQAFSPSPVPREANAVMKLEPHDNGPLFCEINFFNRIGKEDMVKQWIKKNSLNFLGIPKLIDFGLHESDGNKYRYMIIQRFGTDLQKVFEENGRKFNDHTVFLVALQIIDVLDYIHHNGYAHGDIKAANLMTGFKNTNEIYLIDYGLVSKFLIDGKKKVYFEDKRLCHDGTAEYTSRDAHKGVAPSPRGDIEIMAYCMLQWLCGHLPWENNLTDKEYVRSQKNLYMSNCKKLIAPLIKNKAISGEMCVFLDMINNYEYTDDIDYNSIRQVFGCALKKLGHKVTDKLDLFIVTSPLLMKTQRMISPEPLRSPIRPLKKEVNPSKNRALQRKSISDADIYKIASCSTAALANKPDRLNKPDRSRSPHKKPNLNSNNSGNQIQPKEGSKIPALPLKPIKRVSPLKKQIADINENLNNGPKVEEQSNILQLVQIAAKRISPRIKQETDLPSNQTIDIKKETEITQKVSPKKKIITPLDNATVLKEKAIDIKKETEITGRVVSPKEKIITPLDNATVVKENVTPQIDMERAIIFRKKRKRTFDVNDIGTQTSPHLKGLLRTRAANKIFDK